ncbi:hypothetical protein HPB52_010014 [Rhipicephalus sanguineus]|uniref:Peptidase M13 C-terminal domain-containing protein n=1 Tax=Rhipicephalus sanguineus TaxID=34632 RepID=A0A9D4PI69_RHISA|nr:hypothetical protein HPB52_010014 [Rhipicephalus sanguineus]
MTDGVAPAKVPDDVGRSKVEQPTPKAQQNKLAKQATKEPLPSSSPASPSLTSSGPLPLLKLSPKSPPQSASPKPSKSAKISSPVASHGDGTARKSPAAGMNSPSVVLMRRWLQRHRILMCRCTLTATLAAVAAAVLLFAYFRQDLFYPSELLGRPPPFLCSKAAEVVRATLNFSVNPCDDFYTFVCSRGGQVRSEGSAIVWEQIEWKLMNVPWEMDRQGVENKAARFFRSCRRLVSAPTIYVKEHADLLFSLVPEVSINALLQMNSPEKLIELISVVSIKYGMSAFLFFAPGPEETLNVLGIRPPLSTYLDDIDLRLAFVYTVDILQQAYEVAARTLQRLIEIDHDLLLHHGTPGQHEEEFSSNSSLSTAAFDKASPAQETHPQGSFGTGSSVILSPRNGEENYSTHAKQETPSFLHIKRDSSGPSADDDIINTLLPPAKYRVRVGDLTTLRNTLHAVFVDMRATESAVYVLAYLLLPEDLLVAYANRNDKSVCYKLLRFAFWDVWGFLATRMDLAVGLTGDALFIVQAVLGTLKKIVARRDGNRHSSTSITADEIGRLLTSVSSNMDVVDPRSMDGLGSMHVRSLYGNIIELEIFRRTHPPGGNASSTSEGSVRLRQSAKLRVPVEDLVPPSYCQGAFRFLNYATFGVSVALEALKSLGLSFSETGSPGTRPASISEGVRPVRSCFAAEIASLHWPELEGGSTHEREKLLKDVIFWATGFRIALEASELERARTPREFVEPVMMQTFYARYCYHLCERAEDPLFRRDDARWSHLKCNIAVMNVPQFAPLFQCKQNQALFKNEYCSVF